MENKETDKPRSPGRPRTIDRDQVLDAAERIVAEDGAGALTIDAVARAMKITKGGVQYAFGSKEALIGAMFDRWHRQYDASILERAGTAATPLATMRAHVDDAFVADANVHAKGAAVLAALLRSPEHLASTRAWYRDRVAALDLSRPEHRRARLAFLATEGAFMLRYFGLMEIGEDEWQDMHADIARMLAAPGDGTGDA